MEYLKQLGLALLIALVAREIIGSLNGLSRWLVKVSAQKLPAEERERFIEENLAVLDEIEGPLSKLYNAFGCFTAAASLINEHATTSSKQSKASSRKLRVRLPIIPLLASAIQDGNFEWDDVKNAANYAKHGVSFEQARLVFKDAFAIREYDDRADYGEGRFIIVGMAEGVLIFVAYTERGDWVRLISARRATSHEQKRLVPAK